MSYVPWPEDGCTLAEARERTADRAIWKQRRCLIDEYKVAISAIAGLTSIEKENGRDARQKLRTAVLDLEDHINEQFRALLSQRRLIAYGHLGSLTAEPRMIDADFWPVLTHLGWANSAAGERRLDGAVFRGIRIYPTLLAGCRNEIVGGHSLSEAFSTYVLGDPEVAPLGRHAVELAPRFSTVFMKGHCNIYGVVEWPVAFERRLVIGAIHPDASMRSKFEVPRDPDPIEVIVAAGALENRYQALIQMLRRGELQAQGIPTAQSPLESLPRAMWSHEDFYFNVDGDVFQENEFGTGRDGRRRRWLGVMLNKPPANDLPDQIEAPQAGSATRMSKGAIYDAPIISARDALAAGDLATALRTLVFSHPDVERLRLRAVLAKRTGSHPLLETNANMIGRVAGFEEAVLPLRYFPLSEPLPVNMADLEEIAEDWNADGPQIPREYENYYAELNRRAAALIGLLQRRGILGIGHTADGHPVPINQSIWSHEDFYIHPPTGDIYEAGPETLDKRWTAIIFQPSPSFGARVNVSRELHPALPSTAAYYESDGTDAESAAKDADGAEGCPSVHDTPQGRYDLCFEWLVGHMEANRTERSQPKAFWLGEAQRKWSISARSFELAWKQAILKSVATAWSKAGPTKRKQF